MPQHKMYRLPGLLVSSRNRVRQQSGYEPEPRNELFTSWEKALVKDTALGNTVADGADSE